MYTSIFIIKVEQVISIMMRIKEIYDLKSEETNNNSHNIDEFNNSRKSFTST